MTTKAWYTSRTLWVNLIGLFWILFAEKLGLPNLGAETEATILAVINLVLRAITKQEITFSNGNGGGSAKSFLAGGLIFVLGAGQAEAQTASRKWLFEPDLATGAVKIVENDTKDGITANIFPAAGIGVAYRNLEYNADTGEWDAVFGVALDFFVGGTIGGQFNISPTVKAEFFDGWLQVGCGYDIGYVGDRSRVFGLFSSNFGWL
jgi:hypothetical protein